MPLTAISYKDYNHREVVVPVHEMLDRAAREPWSFPYAYPLLKAMVDSEIQGQAEHNHGHGYVSATSVQAPCLRCAILKDHIDFSESVEELYPRFAGTRAHAIIEEYPYPNSINELRLAMDTPHGKVTGKFDILKVEADGVSASLLDLKNTAQPPRYDKVKYFHGLQLQTYRYLVNHASVVMTPEDSLVWNEAATTLGVGDSAAMLAGLNSLDIQHLAIIYAITFPPDFKTLEVRRKEDVPTTTKGAKYATRPKNVPDIWTDQQVEDMLFPRVKQYLEAKDRYMEDGTLPPLKGGIDPVTWNIHKLYTPAAVAAECIRQHIRHDN